MIPGPDAKGDSFGVCPALEFVTTYAILGIRRVSVDLDKGIRADRAGARHIDARDIARRIVPNHGRSSELECGRTSAPASVIAGSEFRRGIPTRYLKRQATARDSHARRT